METDVVAAPEIRRPPIPPPCQSRQRDNIEPHLVDEAGMKKWFNDMLKGHAGGRASTWEQWALQFNGAMDTMSQSL